MINKTILVPVIAFIIAAAVLYFTSNDPDRKKKPGKFIIPSAVIAGISFFVVKYTDSHEPLMQGNYFD